MAVMGVVTEEEYPVHLNYQGGASCASVCINKYEGKT